MEKCWELRLKTHVIRTGLWVKFRTWHFVLRGVDSHCSQLFKQGSRQSGVHSESLLQEQRKCSSRERSFYLKTGKAAGGG